MIAIHCPICNIRRSLNYAIRDGYSYRKCSACTHVFLHPAPKPSVIKKLYSDNYKFRVNEKALKRFSKISESVISQLKKLNSNGKTLLDVGTGYGSFVEIAIEKKLEATGLEPAKNLFKIAQSKLGSKVSNTTLLNFVKTNRRKFDFITLIHVIEHVEDPKNTLSSLLKMLKPGGVLYIETPNIDSHLASIEKGQYTFLTPPDHINLFSKHSIEHLLNILGFSIQSWSSTYSFPEHLVGILRRLKNRQPDYRNTRNANSSIASSTKRIQDYEDAINPPFFDRIVAPLLTPLLDIGNKGSILQVFVKKLN